MPQMNRTEAMPRPWLSSAVLGRGDQLGMIGKAQIIVGAEIEHLARPPSREHADMARLRRQDRPLGLPQRLARGWLRVRTGYFGEDGTIGGIRL